MAAARVPTTLIRKRLNTGLADTRNIGLAHAQAPAVFVLDADNWIYPNCLQSLHSALDQSVAASYGIIRRFDDDTGESLGLLSALAWDAQDLVRRPYLDAMAMFNREAILAVGGYSMELIEHGWFGWEDYDLWLKLASAGKACRQVPRVCSAYRVHPSSMLQRTNRNSENIAKYFHRKFGALVASNPGLESYFGFPAVAPKGGGPRIPDNLSAEELDQRCRALTAELSAVYESASWRVTSPLRAVYRLLTGRP